MLQRKNIIITFSDTTTLSVSGLFGLLPGEIYPMTTPVDVNQTPIFAGFFECAPQSKMLLGATFVLGTQTFRIGAVSNLIQLNGNAHYRIQYTEVDE